LQLDYKFSQSYDAHSKKSLAQNKFRLQISLIGGLEALVEENTDSTVATVPNDRYPELVPLPKTALVHTMNLVRLASSSRNHSRAPTSES